MCEYVVVFFFSISRVESLHFSRKEKNESNESQTANHNNVGDLCDTVICLKKNIFFFTSCSFFWVYFIRLSYFDSGIRCHKHMWLVCELRLYVRSLRVPCVCFFFFASAEVSVRFVKMFIRKSVIFFVYAREHCSSLLFMHTHIGRTRKDRAFSC